MGKNTGKVREFCQSGKVGTMVQYYFYSNIGDGLNFVTCGQIFACKKCFFEHLKNNDKLCINKSDKLYAILVCDHHEGWPPENRFTVKLTCTYFKRNLELTGLSKGGSTVNMCINREMRVISCSHVLRVCSQ